MALLVIAFLLCLPILDLYLLVRTGETIGAWNTVLLVLVMSLLGLIFAKRQGRMVLLKINTEMKQGRMPGDSLLHGALVFLGGVLLIAPGFVSGLLGLALVIPFFRRFLLHSLRKSIEDKIREGEVKVYRHVYRSYESEGDREIIDINSPKNTGKNSLSNGKSDEKDF
ncbi:MAG: FxsA family protein [Bdellovibrionales bacterium]|nr:FxsA family protein [Bdellovibrionales bacterium]